ncbi:MAG: hypothetical protein ACLPVY_03535 [Acidimicrobiia bacterium]
MAGISVVARIASMTALTLRGRARSFMVATTTGAARLRTPACDAASR